MIKRDSNLSPWPPDDAPECPICDAPAVSRSGGSRTLMAGNSGYDDDGEYHDHDPNWNQVTLECENGHAWIKKTRSTCPNPECDYGGETQLVVFHGEDERPHK